MARIYYFECGKPVTTAKSACLSFDCSDRNGYTPKVTRQRDGRAKVVWINQRSNAAFDPIFLRTEANAWEMIWSEVGEKRLDDAIGIGDKTFFSPISCFDTKDKTYKATKKAAMDKLNGLPFDEDLGV